MSPISPFSINNGLGKNWSKWQEDYNLSRSEKCPICGSVLKDVWGTIGGFSGHEHVHPSSVVGYQCSKCNRYFPLGELMLLKEEKARKEARVRNFWKNIRVVFLNPYLYIIAVSFILISHSFWVGIVASVIVVLLMSLLAKNLEIIFAPLGKLVRKILPSNKPPNNPKTP